MVDMILHHYPLSTFSEKVRLAFGLKRLAYREVLVPVLSPKPDLVALTGGYRRAPVLQIGADVYCDTELILRVLERVQPEPTLFPGGTKGEATAIAWWAERFVFSPALGFIANVNDDLYDTAFVAERKAFGFLLGKEDVRPLFDRYVQQLAAHLGWLADMLEDGRPFLLGDQVSAADLAAYPAIWFVRKWGGSETERLLPIEPLLDWVARVATLGHGHPTTITGAQALEVARAAEPAVLGIRPDADPTGHLVGSRVTVAADDNGRDPVAGTLVAADDQEVVIRLDSDRLGAVYVHFPRAGYDVTAS